MVGGFLNLVIINSAWSIIKNDRTRDLVLTFGAVFLGVELNLVNYTHKLGSTPTLLLVKY